MIKFKSLYDILSKLSYFLKLFYVSNVILRFFNLLYKNVFKQNNKIFLFSNMNLSCKMPQESFFFVD